jgi:hypothetical protein
MKKWWLHALRWAALITVLGGFYLLFGFMILGPANRTWPGVSERCPPASFPGGIVRDLFVCVSVLVC